MWLNKIYTVHYIHFKNNCNSFPCRDKLLPVFKHGSLRSEENVYLAILYTHKSVSENVFLINFFQKGRCYALADVIANFIVEDGVSHRQMVLPTFYHLADVLALFNTVAGVTLHYMFSLIMAGVIVKWQDGTATFILKGGRCYFLQAWGSHVWKLAKACLYKEIIYSVLENNLITWNQTEWEVSICNCNSILL